MIKGDQGGNERLVWDGEVLEFLILLDSSMISIRFVPSKLVGPRLKLNVVPVWIRRGGEEERKRRDAVYFTAFQCLRRAPYV